MWRTTSYPGYAAVSGMLARQDCPATRRTIVSLNNDGNICLQTAFISYPDYTILAEPASTGGRSHLKSQQESLGIGIIIVT